MNANAHKMYCSSSTPPPPCERSSDPNSQTKSASRLSRIAFSIEALKPPKLSLDLIPSSPNMTPSAPTPSTTNTLPLHELLLLSPSPSRKSRTRLAERLEMAEEAAAEPNVSRKRCKGSRNHLSSCASPRGNRRSRRRLEIESREERDLEEEIVKARKRRHSGKSKKEKLALVPSSIASLSSSQKVDDDYEYGDGGNLDRFGMIVYDLIMWKDAAKSTLWFGFGCLCFLSSCFAEGIHFSIFSAISQLGLLFLAASFCSHSISQRNNVESRRKFRLKEEDILRVGRLVLPAANLAISKTRELFSGEPSMTLKVTPFLLLGAEYGHLITLKRLCAIWFFISFTVPKLYSCYSSQIKQKVECTKCWVLEAWRACSHKKIVAATAITTFWNLSNVKTRIFTAFMAWVILRCCREHILPKQGGEAEVGEQEAQQALVLAEGVTSQKQWLLSSP